MQLKAVEFGDEELRTTENRWYKILVLPAKSCKSSSTELVQQVRLLNTHKIWFNDEVWGPAKLPAQIPWKKESPDGCYILIKENNEHNVETYNLIKQERDKTNPKD